MPVDNIQETAFNNRQISTINSLRSVLDTLTGLNPIIMKLQAVQRIEMTVEQKAKYEALYGPDIEQLWSSLDARITELNHIRQVMDGGRTPEQNVADYGLDVAEYLTQLSKTPSA